jgi:hypothetical protein
MGWGITAPDFACQRRTVLLATSNISVVSAAVSSLVAVSSLAGAGSSNEFPAPDKSSILLLDQSSGGYRTDRWWVRGLRRCGSTRVRSRRGLPSRRRSRSMCPRA